MRSFMGVAAVALAAITGGSAIQGHKHHVSHRCVVLQKDQQRFASWVYEQPTITEAMRWELKYDWACAWSGKAAQNMQKVVGVYRSRREARIPKVHVLLDESGYQGIPGMTSFDWCVAKGESGDGQNTSNGVDFGWFQFLPSTYDSTLAAMATHGIKTAGWDPSPLTAPVWQQVAAFNYQEPLTPSGWPNTVPPCL